MRKHLKMMVPMTVVVGLLLTASPAHAYKVIEKRVEVIGMDGNRLALSTATYGKPLMISVSSLYPGQAAPIVVNGTAQPIFISAREGQQFVPVEVKIHERHRHRIMGLFARHHWTTRTETILVPVNGSGSVQTQSVVLAMVP